VNGFSIWDSQHNTVTFDSVIRIEQITSNPAATTGYSTIYARAAADGNTGVYVSNEKKVGEELITKKKAFLYSLIL
jgi:transcription elongation GreA/GreB family factor